MSLNLEGIRREAQQLCSCKKTACRSHAARFHASHLHELVAEVERLQGEVARLTDERDLARDVAAALEGENAAALAFHYSVGSPGAGRTVWCGHDVHPWPCPTASALGVEASGSAP